MKEDGKIQFHINDNQGNPQVWIEITKEGFFYQGKKVNDVNKVYEHFNQWLIVARAKERMNFWQRLKWAFTNKI